MTPCDERTQVHDHPQGSHSWTVALAKVRGTSHLQTGVPCQDDVLCPAVDEQGSLIIAVSDGAGSGRFSHHGSAVAVRSSSFLLREALDHHRPLTSELLQHVALQSADHVRRVHEWFAAAGVEADLRDFACTLILVAVRDDRLAMAQIGDGAVVASGPDGLLCLSPPTRGEYVNETTFLTSARTSEDIYAREDDGSGIRAIAAMTDGVQHLGIRYPGNEPFPNLFNPVFEHVQGHADAPATLRNRELELFLDSEVVNAETDDDKTLVVAVRSNGTREPIDDRGSSPTPPGGCDRCGAARPSDAPYCGACGHIGRAVASRRRFRRVSSGFRDAARVLHRRTFGRVWPMR